ncbi:uncharacterized protein CMU_030540 [Cryptosporidium muris RN66]|uniref:Uncharacterized protein n=1 Tax=Cryptosporidium muris (strain RN66) TaxID=441375 RepID=B6AK24_CRYMR|nr:uncharacterized protein CMU_030540 [Cryptosporidium muris RN66]EEA08565.1 hypothetical protein, conserved [Cryptosporidium muris RN66]|eukprot:XP_002142914.1 hypothetical protein [Cryptosporidium muris RN66]
MRRSRIKQNIERTWNDYESQTSIEDVSEWAEHIEQVIDDLQRNYKIIQAEMDYLMERSSVISRPRYISPKRVTVVKKLSNSNLENRRNFEQENSYDPKILNNYKEYNNEVNYSKIEEKLVEKLQRSCDQHHLEFQRSITEVKVQQAITESTVKDIADQVDILAKELKAFKDMQNDKISVLLDKINSQTEYKLSPELESSEIEYNCENKVSKSCSCTTCSDCDKLSKLDSKNNKNCLLYGSSSIESIEDDKGINRRQEIVTILHEVLLDLSLFKENNISSLSDISLLRTLLKECIMSITTEKTQITVDNIISDMENLKIKQADNETIIKKYDILESLINNINKSIDKQNNMESNHIINISKLENSIENIKKDIFRVQDSINKIEHETNENINKIEESLKLRINELEEKTLTNLSIKIDSVEEGLVNRTEILKSAIKELKDQLDFQIQHFEEKFLKVDYCEENHKEFNQIKVIVEQVKNIKESVDFISEDVLLQESKLKKQVQKYYKNLQEIQQKYEDFERNSQHNHSELALSLKNFRSQVINILTSIYDIINEDFPQQPLQNNIWVPSDNNTNINIIKDNQIQSSDSDEHLHFTSNIPPNAYYYSLVPSIIPH